LLASPLYLFSTCSLRLPCRWAGLVANRGGRAFLGRRGGWRGRGGACVAASSAGHLPAPLLSATLPFALRTFNRLLCARWFTRMLHAALQQARVAHISTGHCGHSGTLSPLDSTCCSAADRCSVLFLSSAGANACSLRRYSPSLPSIMFILRTTRNVSGISLLPIFCDAACAVAAFRAGTHKRSACVLVLRVLERQGNMLFVRSSLAGRSVGSAACVGTSALALPWFAGRG